LTVTAFVSVFTTIARALALATVPRTIVIVSGVVADPLGVVALVGALVSMLPALDPRLQATSIGSADSATSSRDEHELTVCIGPACR
jgi:hypothetical protein